MRTKSDQTSKVRLLGEIFVVIIAFTVFTIAIGLLLYKMQAGFGEEPVMPTSNVGREMVALATLFTTPLTMFCTLLVIEFLLQSRGSDTFSFGLEKPKNLGRTVGLGIIFAGLFMGAWFLVGNFVPDFAEEELTQYFALIRGNGMLYFFSMTAVAWFAAGFAEEVIFRGFLMNNVLGIAGGGPVGIFLAILMQAIFFTGFHATDSLIGMVPVFVIGLLMGGIYFVLGRKLWPLIIAHAIVLNIYFTSIYFGTPI